MILASEDTVSEVVLQKLLAVFRPELRVGVSIGNRGKGYLKSRARELNRAARGTPVFLLIDADTREPCPADVIGAWLHGAAEDRMLFRVAIMEVESWILADRENCSKFLAIPEHRIPADTDAISKPKEFVVNLARRSRKRDIRDELVPAHGAIVAVGAAYNMRVSEFVNTAWDPKKACRSSDSLRRAVNRLREAF